LYLNFKFRNVSIPVRFSERIIKAKKIKDFSPNKSPNVAKADLVFFVFIPSAKADGK